MEKTVKYVMLILATMLVTLLLYSQIFGSQSSGREGAISNVSKQMEKPIAVFFKANLTDISEHKDSNGVDIFDKIDSQDSQGNAVSYSSQSK